MKFGVGGGSILGTLWLEMTTEDVAVHGRVEAKLFSRLVQH